MSIVSSASITHYREEGYCLIPNLIPQTSIEAARQRASEIGQQLAPWPSRHFQVLDPERYRSESDTPLPAGIQQPASQEAVFADVADHANLSEAMAALLGGDVERFTDQIGIKHGRVNEAQGGRSYYHQDSYYWKIAPELGCNCWIPLTSVGVNASALAIMPTSHRGWHLVEHESYYDDPPWGRVDSGAFVPFKRHRIPQEQVDNTRETLVQMQPGDGLFFSNYTWHRSEPNTSGQTRVFYAIAYQRQS
ncbi:MAG: phytanoyl-CoA dioxygenase family protein [Candidatus Latescibacterota bacterium]